MQIPHTAATIINQNHVLRRRFGLHVIPYSEIRSCGRALQLLIPLISDIDVRHSRTAAVQDIIKYEWTYDARGGSRNLRRGTVPTPVLFLFPSSLPSPLSLSPPALKWGPLNQL